MMLMELFQRFAEMSLLAEYHLYHILAKENVLVTNGTLLQGLQYWRGSVLPQVFPPASLQKQSHFGKLSSCHVAHHNQHQPHFLSVSSFTLSLKTGHT